jgi:hypothetical protein
VQSRLLDLRAGKAGKLKRTPIEQGFAPIDTAGTGTQADTPTDLPWDPYGPVVPLFNYGRRAGELTFFNARSGHHTPKLKVGTPPRTTLRACFLPSRRVLLMSTSLKFDRTDPQQIIRLFITNPERTRAVQLDTSALGHVSSMICTATSRGEMLYAAADNGNVYEVAAEAAQLDPTIVPAAPAAPIP